MTLWYTRTLQKNTKQWQVMSFTLFDGNLIIYGKDLCPAQLFPLITNETQKLKLVKNQYHRNQ